MRSLVSDTHMAKIHCNHEKHGGLHLKAGARQYAFNLTVAPPAPPVVRIIGPSSVSDACSFRFLAAQGHSRMKTVGCLLWVVCS